MIHSSLRRIVFLAFTFLVSQSLWSQCDITTNANRTSITCGTCVTLSAFGSGTGNLAFSENFNSGAPVGWQFTQSAQFNNPCSPGGVDGTTHLWMGAGSINPRDMVTVPLDLSLGGSICFDMLFAVQGQASPCEGPDEPQEGVYVEYSVDGGATWNTIHYFNPNGGNDPQLTNWNNWCFILPPGAVEASNTETVVPGSWGELGEVVNIAVGPSRSTSKGALVPVHPCASVTVTLTAPEVVTFEVGAVLPVLHV